MPQPQLSHLFVYPCRVSTAQFDLKLRVHVIALWQIWVKHFGASSQMVTQVRNVMVKNSSRVDGMERFQSSSVL